MTAYDRTPDVGGAVSFTASFQVTGDVTEEIGRASCRERV